MTGPPLTRLLLGLAAVAVAFAAADTYVVVLSLPDMMTSVGLSMEKLQRAAPIISGFLLGYVAMLPLIGRIADLRGRLPVLIASLIVFAIGSLVTAAAYDLPSLVTGRFLQGVGGGGLVPVTLALVADIYPVDRRGVPLGVVGAVQELGSVFGPLYGAGVLAFGTWRDIFWINLTVGLVLAAAVVTLGSRSGPPSRSTPSRRPDFLGLTLLGTTLAGVLLVMISPDSLTTSITWGGPFVSFHAGGPRWWSRLGVATVLSGALLLARMIFAQHPLVDLRDWWSTIRQADLVGAGWLSVALGGVILAFATADPEVQVFSRAGPWFLAAAGLAAVLFWRHSSRADAPLIPHGALAQRPAWGSLLVSFFVGAALIAALIDIPIFARVSIYGDSQVKAALVLVEFLVALPVGALIGGFLTRRLPAGLITSVGMAASALGFVLMSHWGEQALHHLHSSLTLALTGLGFGLALAPVNAALLACTEAAVHGVSSALLVVSRMVGMLVGISALTTLGLRQFYASQADFPTPNEVCGGDSTNCATWKDMLQAAGLDQLHVIFEGAAVCAVIAGLIALVTFVGAGTRETRTADLLRAGGQSDA